MVSDEGGEGSTWSTPKFRFEVDLGDELKGAAFQEVSGLDGTVQIIEYRNSGSALYSSPHLPGVAHDGNVTLKRGVFINNNAFWNWMDDIEMNIVERQAILIRLVGEDGNPVMQWQLKNAWPTKITGTDLKSDGNEIAVDSLEIAYEQLLVTAG